jgi:hypothetical protein
MNGEQVDESEEVDESSMELSDDEDDEDNPRGLDLPSVDDPKLW